MNKQYSKKLTAKKKEDYEKLSKKIPSLTIEEYTQYANMITLANQKGKRMLKQNSIAKVNFSESIGGIVNREVFEKRFTTLKNVLTRTYAKNVSNEVRERAKDNILYLYGDNEVSQQIIKKIDSMSDSEYVNFIKDNRDLEVMFYKSQPAVKEYYDLVEEEQEKILSRM